jgi:SPP1 gp7 family putative phage head morphogenesis protein
MTSQISKQLAARAVQRQAESLIELAKIEARIEKAMDAKISRLVAVAASPRSEGAKMLELAGILEVSLREIIRVTRKQLELFTVWSHRSAAWALMETIPRPWLVSRVPRDDRVLLEVSNPARSGFLLGGYSGIQVIEDTTPFGVPAKQLAKLVLSDTQKDEVLQAILFPAPSKRLITQILAATGWEERFQSLSGLITNGRALLNQMIRGYADGENLQQIAKRVEPLVGGIKASARRIARTEGMRVAERMQRRSWEPLGDLMVGVQIIAVLDERTRPEHATRNGTVYYNSPKPGQKSIAELPDLPDQPNCRCMSVPVMAPPAEIESDPKVRAAFAEIQGVGVPDPATHEKWFSKVDQKRRMLVVGVGRYRAIEKLIGQRDPEWSDFINADGELLSVSQLQAESIVDRTIRKQAVQRMMQERGDALQSLATRGFL